MKRTDIWVRTITLYECPDCGEVAMFADDIRHDKTCSIPAAPDIPAVEVAPLADLASDPVVNALVDALMAQQVEIMSHFSPTLRDEYLEQMRSHMRETLRSLSLVEPPSAPEPLSVQEAAGILGVHPNTVRGWLRSGMLSSLFAEDVEALRARVYMDDSPSTMREYIEATEEPMDPDDPRMPS